MHEEQIHDPSVEVIHVYFLLGFTKKLLVNGWTKDHNRTIEHNLCAGANGSGTTIAHSWINILFIGVLNSFSREHRQTRTCAGHMAIVVFRFFSI